MVNTKDAPKNRKPNGNTTRGAKNRTKPSGGRANPTGSFQPWHGYVEAEDPLDLSKSLYAFDVNQSGSHNQLAGKQRSSKAGQTTKSKPRSNSAAFRNTQTMPQNSSTAMISTSAGLESTTLLQSNRASKDNHIRKLDAEVATAREAERLAQNAERNSTALVKSLTEQLEASEKQHSQTKEASATSTTVDTTASDCISTLETDNKTLRNQVTQTQTELSTVRSTQTDAVKQKLEAGNQVRSLQTELDSLKKSAAQQSSQASQTELISQLETQVQSLNSQVAQSQVDLTAARDAEQAAADREKGVRAESEELRSQLTAAQQKTSPHDSIDVAVAVQTSALEAEKKDLQDQLVNIRKELSMAQLAERTAKMSETMSQTQLQHAESEIQKLREELDLALNKPSETSTATKVKPAAQDTNRTGSKTSQDRISQLERQLQFSLDSIVTVDIAKTEAQETTVKLQSEVERLSRQISLAASQEAAARLAEDKAIKRAASAKSEVEILKGEVGFLRESVSRTQREQLPLRERIDKAERLLEDKNAILRRYQQRHITGTDTNKTGEANSERHKKALVYVRYRNPEQVADLEQRLQHAQEEQKAAQDEAARLRDAADKLRVSLQRDTTVTTAMSSGPVLKLCGGVDELKGKLHNDKTLCKYGRVPVENIESAQDDGNSKPSLDLLRGQLMLAEKLTRSAQDEKTRSIAETIRLRGDLATYKRFELDVVELVENGRKDFRTLQAELRETKKQLRKYTGNIKKLKETTVGAENTTSRSKTKIPHLQIQTKQLATLREKDREIEELRVRAGITQSKLTSTIIARNDEIKNLKAKLRLANHAPKTSINKVASSAFPPKQPLESTAPTYTDLPPAPYTYHKMSQTAQALLDAEIAQSRQFFEQTRMQRSNAFRQFKLEQETLPNRHEFWETLEEETYQDQQNLRRDFQLNKEALIRKTRLAEDWLKVGLAKQEEAGAKQADRKETLAEARKGKKKVQIAVEDFDDLLM